MTTTNNDVCVSAADNIIQIINNSTVYICIPDIIIIKIIIIKRERQGELRQRDSTNIAIRSYFNS